MTQKKQKVLPMYLERQRRAEAGARASALYLEGRCVFCEKTRKEKGREEWDNCSCSK